MPLLPTLDWGWTSCERDFCFCDSLVYLDFVRHLHVSRHFEMMARPAHETTLVVVWHIVVNICSTFLGKEHKCAFPSRASGGRRSPS